MTDTTPGPKQVKRTTLSGLVTEQLREAILSGVYDLGSQLSEMEIAKQCGVSRGPVREAVQRLIQEGLLHSEPHHGVFVADFNDEDLIDIYFAREAIEGAAVRVIASAGRGREVAKVLAETLTLMKSAHGVEDWARVADLDMRFHTQLVEAAGSHRLNRMYRTLVAELKLCMHLLVGGYRGRQCFMEDHEALVNLIGGGDLGAIQAELSKHLDEPVHSLRAARSSDQDQDKTNAETDEEVAGT
jgi:DNA-binding GntR family transcriptional regulator